MINWIFQLVDGREVKSANVTENEDKRIQENILDNQGFLYLKLDSANLYLNLNTVQLIVRQVETVNEVETETLVTNGLL